MSTADLDRSDWAKQQLLPKGWKLEVAGFWPGLKNRFLLYPGQWRMGEPLKKLYTPAALFDSELGEAQYPPIKVYCLKKSR